MVTDVTKILCHLCTNFEKNAILNFNRLGYSNMKLPPPTECCGVGAVRAHHVNGGR